LLAPVEVVNRRPIPHVVTSVEGFLQYVSASVVSRGYYLLIAGRIPDGDDPERVDRKLIGRFEANLPKGARALRKRNGLANCRYLRFERDWFAFFTPGSHPRFEVERRNLKNLRRSPLLFADYSVSSKRCGWLAPGVPDRKFRAHVRIADRQFAELQAHALDICTRYSAESMERWFERLPFEPYGPVKDQVWRIWRKVNRKRLRACQPILSRRCVRVKRHPAGAFD
jgi:hypothetical protein